MPKAIKKDKYNQHNGWDYEIFHVEWNPKYESA